MNERLLDYVFAEFLHPVSIVFRLSVTRSADAVIVDGPQQLPHREFVHQRLELIFKRMRRQFVPLFALLGRSGLALCRLSDGV